MSPELERIQSVCSIHNLWPQPSRRYEPILEWRKGPALFKNSLCFPNGPNLKKKNKKFVQLQLAEKKTGSRDARHDNGAYNSYPTAYNQ